MRKTRNAWTLVVLATLTCVPFSSLYSQMQRIEMMEQIQKGRHVCVHHRPVRKPTSRAVVFEQAKFPIILTPEKDSGLGAHIAFPVQHVEGNTFRADVKLLIEKKNQDGAQEENQRVSIILQNQNTGHASGFMASGRSVPLNKAYTANLSHSFANNSPTKVFYLSVFAPASCPPVKVVDVKLEGYRFIEKELPDEKEEAAIRALIQTLGADKFRDRESAQSRIMEIGPKALPVLEKAKKDDDPERQQRVRHIIAQLKAKDPLRQLTGNGSVW